MNNKHQLLGVPKHANQHRLSRLTMEVHSDELRIVASEVESYTDELIAALEAAEKRIAELEELEELFLRAKALMHQSGGTPIENSLNPVDAWLYEAENATAGKGE
ncbi:hypothetical protein [Enterobacter hormaechei]|uniref:hypothetical protein n=1 Tax=Enterobacter hormaechei TaxID=158836 RepID=UPI000735CA45|nr:hypothetical protein [Enterobacter hormaechei]ELC7432193.1 hypothetical protein [Enterobacter hormaechei]KTH47622.1 hypothetical protein ASV23_19650 [Enterobacter hormaechei subsp. steigerwaltii]MCK7394138.1 hypothetical protein [Enterobacter hormaechei]MED5776889.1 hypothetical protein [Enterobacter hormaechei]HAV1644980.1 hypothetical protein [Enterobacter hormaechei subsp. steigerwaltii]